MGKGSIFAIVLVTVLTFPIIYAAMLIASGYMRIETGFKEDENPELTMKIEEVRHTARRDSLAAQNTKTFEAIVQERAELQKDQERLAEQQSRLEMLQADIEAQKEALLKERELLENKKAAKLEAEAAEQRGESVEARYRKLAKIYEAMKPNEAANILQSLPDADAAYIISKMNDDRQKSKIMALLDKNKVARINKLIK
jgi:flagellar motility protein MotE (MotC chaperone)